MSEQAHATGTHAEPHVVPLKVYYGVFAALLVLTLVTVEAARFDLGHPEWGGIRVPLNVIAALAIAVTKATLVVLYFMHVRYATRLVWLVVGAAIFFLLILFGITGADYVSRGWLGNPGT